MRTGALSPSAGLPGLDGEQLRLLRRVGRAWGRVSPPGAWHRALPVDSDLGTFPSPSEIRPVGWGRLVSVTPLGGRPPVSGTLAGELPPGRPGRFGYHLRRVLLGAALKSTAIAQERMRKLVALPVGRPCPPGWAVGRRCPR